MEKLDGIAEKSDSGPNNAESANTTFSFEMLDIIITGGSTNRSKSQGERTKHVAKNTTEKRSFCPSGECVRNSGETEQTGQTERTKRTEPEIYRLKQCTSSDEDAAELREGLHNLGEKGKERKMVYSMNAEEGIKGSPEFSLLDNLLPVEGIPCLASSKGDMPFIGDQMRCLSSGSSSREKHYHTDEKGDKRNDTGRRRGRHVDEQDVDEEVARIEQADEEVILSRSIHCTNCKYYLKELTTRNYMNFSHMDQYIREGEGNLLLLKNKKIEELESRNKLMKRKIGELEKENNMLRRKLGILAGSVGDLRDHIDRVVEKNKVLRKVNKRLRVDHQKGKSSKEEVGRVNKESTNRRNSSSSCHGGQEPLEEIFENSIDNELFEELH
ncbi:conserved Plasmodium protein, unknown function [Plasmodium knowlesi strain H]|uniref:Uncharacterized protein n=3 Tax=Plasmodium knowlesi TaxID=5850 RepID=A0A5K1USJ6_PLAKH|nr:conserved Plasmodium protein, unknown function [Plasmodium knowlesi strain H]OTN64555.1 Uncharacterized protein PKNOH_S130191500 [Plasmodium knowlesi]CAA9989078.1 conserved Plasmodium protein, unknown function [Plasmodium knowlesi strain H]SBO27291.1 conserved Plasmodium protein, unknown function [Plasmodium knowlesi strain H]SBO28918.1 conserved Plasmodium protein, unknown function [Plasmodium knowlesi strain H]VVS78552.1 conserved Plasmodium protein, unknown function [Plasmodium knowlesi |eukprot:XP_002261426.1 hypothetical protein, conserved in Plasmodium species [Plasmodium knowlesi strain H]